MSDEPEIDPFFGDMSQYPVEDEELSSEEIEAINDPNPEYVPDEWYIEQFVEKFGYPPKIKEWNAFVSYVLMDFDEEWRDAAVEVEHERS